jgi:hypothetical protein
MSSVYIRALIHSFDYGTNQIFVAFDHSDPYLLPKQKMDDTISIDENLNKLITSMFVVDPRWLGKKLKSVEKLGSDYIITYEIQVPHELKMMKGTRLSHESMMTGKFLIPEQRLLNVS